MAFTSISFFLFLPVVYLIFYLTADRWRWLVLLGASYGFYATFKAPHLLAALLVVTCVSYACGLGIAAQQDEIIRKRWLWSGSLACVAVLCFFKYFPLYQSHNPGMSGLGGALPSTLISVGVSYYAFQALSYLADIYLEIQEPERHLGYHALALAFFPKLLQGPIERAGDLLPQLKRPYRFDYDAVRSGMILFTYGLFKKVVLADRLALYPDKVYGDVHAYTGLTLVIATYVYALQIFFDFAGYTDMARGMARMFGITLSENFRSPYLATSIADFWRRWHISFSRWILDYIFKPLQIAWRDHGRAGTALALLVTFLVSGIWHGASAGFVIWGLLHGIYLATSTYYRPYQKRLHGWLGTGKNNWLKAWQVFVTFNLVSFAWIFFRAASLGDAWYVVTNIWPLSGRELKETFFLRNGGNLMVVLFCLALFFIAALRPEVEAGIKGLFVGRRRWLFYYAFVMMILICGTFGKSNFIYVNF